MSIKNNKDIKDVIRGLFLFQNGLVLIVKCRFLTSFDKHKIIY